MSNEEIAISVKGVSKYFAPYKGQTSVKSAIVSAFKSKKNRDQKYSREGYWALNDISFDVKKGEFFGIVGRNGSGKSTLLKMIAGVYQPTKGNIQVNGKLVPFIELGVGFNPELTGRDNVFLNGALLGFSRKEMTDMYDEIVSFAELEDHMDVKLKNFSSGMMVRLAFSIAIRAKSDILLLDEVLAVGDMNFQQKCFDYFKKIKDEKRTVVLVSHDSSLIERFCDRVAFINDSRLIVVGQPKEVVLRFAAIMAEKSLTVISDKDDRNKSMGTGDVNIKKVRVANINGASANTIKMGEPFYIKFLYKSQLPKESSCVLGISINDEEGQVIMGPNTKQSNVLVKPKSSGEISIFFDNNPLSPGTYSITIGVFNEAANMAYILEQDCKKFKILGEQRRGKIHIEPVWKIS